jgi:transposase-like protein
MNSYDDYLNAVEPEEPRCPNCGSTDLKEGVAVRDGVPVDYGCKDCMTPFNFPY